MPSVPLRQVLRHQRCYLRDGVHGPAEQRTRNGHKAIIYGKIKTRRRIRLCSTSVSLGRRDKNESGKFHADRYWTIDVKIR